MQDLAYMIVNTEVIYVLRRRTKHGVSLKVREPSKHDGVYLADESAYLQAVPQLIADLKSGKVIKV